MLLSREHHAAITETPVLSEEKILWQGLLGLLEWEAAPRGLQESL